LKHFLAKEVVQTSAMDCGPASMKCLLESWGIRVSYGRLREACQTEVDGTSIDTMETVANQLGLDAEQVVLPPDHLLLPEAHALPCILVLRLPDGMVHFVVVWNRAGNLVQVMDPAVGRRWLKEEDLAAQIYVHQMSAPVECWSEFTASAEFRAALQQRLERAGMTRRLSQSLIQCAGEQDGWQPMATLDAAVRLTASLIRAGGLRRGRQARAFLQQAMARPAVIPSSYWSAVPATSQENAEGAALVTVRGAVLVRVCGRQAQAGDQPPPDNLAAALTEPKAAPGRELLRLLWRSGRLSLLLVPAALLISSAGVALEALLFRGLFDLTSRLTLASQRMGAITAVVVFGLALFLMELPLLSLAARLGRQLELRLRVALLAKLERLEDRYLQSRLTSDMASRSHLLHQLRQLPELVHRFLGTFFDLTITAAAIAWLEPGALALVATAWATAAIPVFAMQPLLAEHDLRRSNLSAGLSRYYLDGMLGLAAIRCHSAARNLRLRHERMLGDWGVAALRYQRTIIRIEGLQMLVLFGLVAGLLLHRPQEVGIGRSLLIVYWAMNLPSLGQELIRLARQYPSIRNITLRLLEPLGAPEESQPDEPEMRPAMSRSAARIDFRGVTVTVSGHNILQEIDLTIAAESHVAIVGPSGAGKSSLVSLLLGHLTPSLGDVLVDEQAFAPANLRKQIAWVDPAVQLWNRSLFANATYGSKADPVAAAEALDAASLREVLEALPDGLQTRLGESGGLLSGGEGQRVRFARAILRQDVRLAILDEPFRGLDREKRNLLLGRARRLWCGRTLLCITHDIAETSTFDQVIVVEGGRVVESGPPEELLSNPVSRYAELLAAEKRNRADLWSSATWRRLCVRSGHVEETPERIVIVGVPKRNKGRVAVHS
jgi:ABC-type bacteriocin/lantibiotic exporter with double-glycine peptidase domain